jgi:regulation of enolase protein 1 (concanavalin A-like superfamily)
MISVPGIATPFRPFPVRRWHVDPVTALICVESLPGSDIFTGPGAAAAGATAAAVHDAATLLTDAPAGDFALSAEVTGDFRHAFDAGGLFLRHDRNTWATLRLELSPDREATVVSVVTDGVSDNAIAFTVKAKTLHLRISRHGAVFAFHTSSDGFRWRFVRAFALPGAHGALEVGFAAQSPHGNGCDVSFDIPALAPTSITNLRDGS